MRDHQESSPKRLSANCFGDCLPVFFQALLQKRSTSVITTWLSSPLSHVARRTEEDFHPPRARASSWPRGARAGQRGSGRARGAALPTAAPWRPRVALGSARRCRGPRPWPWPCSIRGSRRGHAGGAAPWGTACGCEDSQGLILSFYVLPDCKFLNFLYSL